MFTKSHSIFIIFTIIFNDYYVDLDIDNCHPVITKWLCNNLNIDCFYLTDYIINRENKKTKMIIKFDTD